MVRPVQKLPKRSATVAVFGLLLGGEFCEGLLDLRKEKQGIVAESVKSSRGVQDETFGVSPKRRQRVPVPGDGNHADEPSVAKLFRDIVQLAQQAGIVGFVIGMAGVFMGIEFVRGVTCRADSRRTF